MSRFGPDPHAFFSAVYAHTAPWDIGAAQPAMVALLEAHPPASPILDAGCGSGDLAIHLAQLGHEVIGVDFVAAAVSAAQERMQALPAAVAQRLRFQVGDALRPSAFGQQFGAVVDSGFLHLLDPAQTDAYVGELAQAIRPGGRYYLHAFAVEFPAPNLPREVTASEIQARFTEAAGWRIQTIAAATFLSQVAPPTPAICACVERIAPAGVKGEAPDDRWASIGR